MKLKERLAFDAIDTYDDCAGGKECIADKIQAAYIEGFEKARKMAAESMLVHPNYHRHYGEYGSILTIGEEEV